MTLAHETFVTRRFDALEGRFRTTVADDDVRLQAVRSALRIKPGSRILDLGCGKGRFATHLQDCGAEVIGLDASAAMLASASGIARVRASATSLPFADNTFDGLYAIELFEHLPPRAISRAIREMARVLVPGSTALVIDKNRAALDSTRTWLPASLVKRIDEYRGHWMYGPSDPVRERWFSPYGFARRMAQSFAEVHVHFLLRPIEARHAIFRRWPAARLLVAWTGVAYR